MRIIPRMSRRRSLALVGSLVGGTFLYTWRVEPHWFHVVRRDLPIAGLPKALRGRLMVQISDLHVGPIVDKDYLIRAMKYVSGLGQDLTVITGDFMSCEASERVDDVAEVIGHL